MPARVAQVEGYYDHVQQTGQRNAEVDDPYDILHSADPEITPRMRAGAVTRIEDVLDDQIADWAADNAPPLSQSQAMGINPSAGPTSAAAAIAVDSGATDEVQRQAAEQQAAELAKKQDKSQKSGKPADPAPVAPPAPPAPAVAPNGPQY